MDSPLPLSVAVAPYEPTVVICDSAFLATLDELEGKVTAATITDDKSQQDAATLLNRLGKGITALENKRKVLKAPFLEAGRAIDNLADRPMKRLEVAKAAIKGKLSKYAADLLQKQREEEERRRKEIEELERRKAAEAAQECEEEAPSREEEAPDFAAERLKQLKSTVTVVPAKAVGVREVVRLVPYCEDIHKVPNEYVRKELKLAELKAATCSGWKEGDPLPVVAGIRFDVVHETQGTGKQIGDEFFR